MSISDKVALWTLIFLVLVILPTSLWVLVDARTIGVKKGQISGLFNMGVTGWFLSCLGFWVVGFPAYLVKRSEYKHVASIPRTNSTALDDLRKLAELRSAGVLTNLEFEQKKRQLFGRV